MAEMTALTSRMAEFVQEVVRAMGLSLVARVEAGDDGARINLEGEDGGLLIRRGGEGLQALQHVMATAFRDELDQGQRVIVDCMGYRREKDAELRQMARFTAEKARASGVQQEMGPFNPYERRIVHLAIAEDPAVTSESVGDAYMKTVIISVKS